LPTAGRKKTAVFVGGSRTRRALHTTVNDAAFDDLLALN
jgi:hypothetical protein